MTQDTEHGPRAGTQGGRKRKAGNLVLRVEGHTDEAMHMCLLNCRCVSAGTHRARCRSTWSGLRAHKQPENWSPQGCKHLGVRARFRKYIYRRIRIILTLHKVVPLTLALGEMTPKKSFKHAVP